MKRFVYILFTIIFISCFSYFRIERNEYGEPILDDKVNYTFNEIPSEDDLRKIDTPAV